MITFGASSFLHFRAASQRKARQLYLPVDRCLEFFPKYQDTMG